MIKLVIAPGDSQGFGRPKWRRQRSTAGAQGVLEKILVTSSFLLLAVMASNLLAMDST